MTLVVLEARFIPDDPERWSRARDGDWTAVMADMLLYYINQPWEWVAWPDGVVT